jgi:hypothetical protein
MKFKNFVKVMIRDYKIASIEEETEQGPHIHAIILCRKTVNVQENIDKFTEENPEGTAHELFEYLDKKIQFLHLGVEERAVFFEPKVVYDGDEENVETGENKETKEADT